MRRLRPEPWSGTPGARRPFCFLHMGYDCACSLPLDAPRDPRPFHKRLLSALRMPYYSPGRCGRWRRPFGFWSLVQMIHREGPRPRTLARWWATWRGDVARRKVWRQVKRMPPGPERDEAWRLAALGAIGSAKANLDGAMTEPVESDPRGD